MYKYNKLRKIFISFLVLFIFLYINIPIYADDIDLNSEDIDINSEITNATAETVFSTKENTLNLNSRSCIVLDRLSKHILYGKNEFNKVKMASTTKIMTAILVIENGNLKDTVEVSKKSAGTGGSRLGLKTGDKITINDLLYGLMLCSGNDAAVALAENIGGSIEGFSKLMNETALSLGLNNSHFESPHGLDSDGHYTTAYELALLSDYALKNPTFLKIVATKNYTVTINGYPKSLSNTNELLGNLEGIYGIKTGFTNGANRCLVTACKRNNMDIICIVLGADTKKFRTQDSIKLIEYAFKNFEYINIDEIVNKELNNWKEKNQNVFYVDKGISNNIEIEVENSYIPVIPIKKDLVNNIQTTINIQTSLSAPIQNTDVLGNITVHSNDTKLANMNILSKSSIKKKEIHNYLFDFFKNYPDILKTGVN